MFFLSIDMIRISLLIFFCNGILQGRAFPKSSAVQPFVSISFYNYNMSFFWQCLISILHIFGLEHFPICIQKDLLCTIKFLCVPILTIIISFIHIYVSHGVFFEQFVVFYVIHNVSFNISHFRLMISNMTHTTKNFKIFDLEHIIQLIPVIGCLINVEPEKELYLCLICAFFQISLFYTHMFALIKQFYYRNPDKHIFFLTDDQMKVSIKIEKKSN